MLYEEKDTINKTEKKVTKELFMELIQEMSYKKQKPNMGKVNMMWNMVEENVKTCNKVVALLPYSIASAIVLYVSRLAGKTVIYEDNRNSSKIIAKDINENDVLFVEGVSKEKLSEIKSYLPKNTKIITLYGDNLLQKNSFEQIDLQSKEINMKVYK